MCSKQLLPCVFSGLVLLAGCSGEQGASHQVPIPTPQASEMQKTPAEDLKAQLESLAELGEWVSGMETIGDKIQAMKATDAEKGADLEKDYQELQSLKGAEQIKAKAKEMAEKL